LQSHVIPAVATAAKFMAHALPKMEWDLQAALEATESDVSLEKLVCKAKLLISVLNFFQIFEKEIAKNTKGVILSLQQVSENQSIDRTYQKFWDFN
jgi:hypothetical protein